MNIFCGRGKDVKDVNRSSIFINNNILETPGAGSKLDTPSEGL